MTDTEKLFIKVLESKGWTKWVNSIPSDDYGPKTNEWWFPPGVQTGDFRSGKMVSREKLPKLTLDLLHEWEMEYLANCKTVDEKSLWFDLLSIEAGWGDAKTVNDAHFLSELNVATATKEQRLRALARTLGIKEEQ